MLIAKFLGILNKSEAPEAPKRWLGDNSIGIWIWDLLLLKYIPDLNTTIECFKRRTIGLSRTQFYLGRQHILLVASFITQDSMKFFVLTTVLAACAVSSLVRFKIAFRLSLVQWHHLMAKMFAQGTAVTFDGSLISMRSPEITACCPCINGACGDGTRCTPYCGYRPWYV